MIHHLQGEKYKCFNCNNDYNWDEVNSNWKCPDCGENISVCAEVNNNKFVINRIEAKNIEPRQHTMMIGYDYYDVIENNGRLKISLKGYGSTDKNPTEFVNCIIGSY